MQPESNISFITTENFWKAQYIAEPNGKTSLTGDVSLLIIAGLELGILSAPILQYNLAAWGRDFRAK